MKTKIVNIGCGNTHLTNRFDDVDEVRIDLCSWVKPDIVLDAVELRKLPEKSFDGAWMCHVLEHIYEHQVPVVLDGINHILKDDGFLFLQVPDLRALLREVVENELDLDSVYYVSYTGLDIRVIDVIYGYQDEVRKEHQSGKVFNQHLTGFDSNLLLRHLKKAGFKKVYMSESEYEVKAICSKSKKLSKWVEDNFKIKEELLLV